MAASSLPMPLQFHAPAHTPSLSSRVPSFLCSLSCALNRLKSSALASVTVYRPRHL